MRKKVLLDRKTLVRKLENDYRKLKKVGRQLKKVSQATSSHESVLH